MVICVVGRIGVGKSTISRYLSEHYDFEYIEIDKLAKTIYNTDKMKQWLHENIPEAIGENNVIDFSMIRSIIFRDSVKNSSLLEISIPILSQKVCEIVSKNPDKNYVIETFMMEVSCLIDVKKFFIVLASDETIKTRVFERDHRPEDETDKILDFQDDYIQRNFLSSDTTFDFSKSIFIDNDNGVEQSIVYQKIDNEIKTLISQ